MRMMSVYGPWISSYPQEQLLLDRNSTVRGCVLQSLPCTQSSPCKKSTTCGEEIVENRFCCFVFIQLRYILAVEEADEYSYLIVHM